MPSESLSDIKQKDWAKCCKKLGLIIEKNRGKGGHFLIKNPKDNTKYTLQYKLNKHINRKILSKLKQWGYSEDEIFQELR